LGVSLHYRRLSGVEDTGYAGPGFPLQILISLRNALLRYALRYYIPGFPLQSLTQNFLSNNRSHFIV